MVKENVLPSPTMLFTLTSPCISSQSCLTIAKPNPVPPNWRVVEVSACVKDSNNELRCLGSIPIPVSITEHCKNEPSVVSSIFAVTITSPFKVNLTALPIKLFKIWRNLFGSLIISLTVI